MSISQVRMPRCPWQKTRYPWWRRGLIVAALLASGLVRAAPVLHLDIPAGPLSDALFQLSHVSGVPISFDWEAVNSRKTYGLKGDYELSEALRRLLGDTGLTFGFWSKRTVVVFAGSDGKKDTPTVPDVQRQPQTVLVQAPAWHGEMGGLVGVDEIFVSRQDVERSPVTTTADLINTLPQVFGGGPNENTQRGNGAETNPEFGSGINLRGLGDDVSLVLVNGRRIYSSGTAGAFTDIAGIPLSAIDGMAVVFGGATLRYGLDAIGGIVNFITRQDEGLETQAEVGGFAAGALYQERFSQSCGIRWDRGNFFALFDYYERDALPASRRSLATSNLLPFGGNNFDTPYGNPGNLVSDNLLWAIPRGQNGIGLAPSQLVPDTLNLYDQYGQGATVLPRQQRSSVVLSGEQAIGYSGKVFLDVILGHRDVLAVAPGESLAIQVLTHANPFYVNPGGYGIQTVLYGFGRDLGPVVTHDAVNTGQLAAGVDYVGGLFDRLEIYTNYAYEQQRQVKDGLVNPIAVNAAVNDPSPATALDVFGDGSYTNPATLAAIRATGYLLVTSQLTSLNMTGVRRFFQMPGGSSKLTLSAEYRRQTLYSTALSPFLSAGPIDLGRTTTSVFAENELPFVGQENRIAGIYDLRLSAAVRHERYSDVGAGVTAPQFAIAYRPTQRVFLRGTWARLFHPPELPDLSAENNTSGLYPLATSSQTTTTALVLNGGDGSLKPERAVTWTLGVEWGPLLADGLSVGATFFHTDFVNRLSQPQLPANVLEDHSWSWLLRPVTAAGRDTICQSSQFLGSLAECLSAPIGAIVDLRLRNIMALDTEGVDLAARYELDRGAGSWTFGLNSTYLFQYMQRQSPVSPVQNLLSTDHNPIDLRLRGAVSWQWRGFWSCAVVNFQNSYEDVDSSPSRSVNSWTTVDAAVGYDMQGRSGAVVGERPDKKGSLVAIRARNVFNHQPPFLNNQYGIGYDQENGSLVGREVTFEVIWRW